MNPVIASATLFAQRPGEERFVLQIRIGTPYQIGPDEWACPVAVAPLYEFGDIHGDGSLQALCLALRFAFELLRRFKQNGGLLFSSDGEEFPLEAFWFGERN